uniref:Thiamine biosynthesis protein n=1 Tax=Caulacanthus ustulatus TaxID=31411 RepID=UPI0027DA5281|nr:Thiamine biosynthesis protein [Caulacanthus ustulatus]WCH57411.1 Thiamine biosynthesis protein [Caulacanthus ustulatus]
MNLSYNTIFINGKAFNCLYAMSLKDLILYFDFDISTVIIEHNSNIISHCSFEKTFFKDQDNIEIITIVGGG